MDRSPPRFNTKARAFFLLVFVWSILFWSLTTISGGIDEFPGSILFYLGGAGPLVAALVITHAFEAHDVQKDFWSRTLNPTRIPWSWMLPALLLHPAIILGAGFIENLLGGDLQLNASILSSPIPLLTLALSVFVLGPLPEEMGWRGVGYERLQMTMTPLGASLTLGAVWALWHVPLFFIENTFQHGLGAGSVRFWVFLLSNIPLTVLITWIYNQTDRSVLIAAIVHFSGNMVGAILPKSDRFAVLELAGLVLIAGLVSVVTHSNLGWKASSVPPESSN